MEFAATWCIGVRPTLLVARHLEAIIRERDAFGQFRLRPVVVVIMRYGV